MTGLFGKPQAPGPAPVPDPPPRMPDLNSPEALLAKRRTIAEANEGGRRSTTLTGGMAQGAATLAGSGGSKLGG